MEISSLTYASSVSALGVYSISGHATHSDLKTIFLHAYPSQRIPRNGQESGDGSISRRTRCTHDIFGALREFIKQCVQL